MIPLVAGRLQVGPDSLDSRLTGSVHRVQSGQHPITQDIAVDGGKPVLIWPVRGNCLIIRASFCLGDRAKGIHERAQKPFSFAGGEL